MVLFYPRNNRYNDDEIYEGSDYESDYESDDDEEFVDYNQGDNGSGLAVVCQWNERIFGRTNDSSKGINNHWIVMEIININKMNEMSSRYEFYKNHCGGHVSLEVVKWECLPGLELVGYWKTYWIKLVQRRWKSVLTQRNEITKKRMNTKSLIYREKHGKWPEHLIIMPTLRGMLAK